MSCPNKKQGIDRLLISKTEQRGSLSRWGEHRGAPLVRIRKHMSSGSFLRALRLPPIIPSAIDSPVKRLEKPTPPKTGVGERDSRHSPSPVSEFRPVRLESEHLLGVSLWVASISTQEGMASLSEGCIGRPRAPTQKCRGDRGWRRP